MKIGLLVRNNTTKPILTFINKVVRRRNSTVTTMLFNFQVTKKHLNLKKLKYRLRQWPSEIIDINY